MEKEIFDRGNLFSRTESLIGVQALGRLAQSRVTVLGLGGVGGMAAEALARSGVGEIVVIDGDVISETNINRQVIALHSTIGQAKAQVMCARILDINPACKVTAKNQFLTKSDFPVLLSGSDYIVDAIDMVTVKLDLAEYCEREGLQLICSLGTGNKLDPSRFRIVDIYETKVCPLARVMRRELKKRDVKGLKVLYSDEQPAKALAEDNPPDTGRHAPASISFVPPAAGLIIAGQVVRELAGL